MGQSNAADGRVILLQEIGRRKKVSGQASPRVSDVGKRRYKWRLQSRGRATRTTMSGWCALLPSWHSLLIWLFGHTPYVLVRRPPRV